MSRLSRPNARAWLSPQHIEDQRMTLEDVKTAKETLEREGLTPSYNAIVQRLGGSKRDVARLMQQLTAAAAPAPPLSDAPVPILTDYPVSALAALVADYPVSALAALGAELPLPDPPGPPLPPSPPPLPPEPAPPWPRPLTRRDRPCSRRTRQQRRWCCGIRP
jgi:Plasmid replication region DNA-binding N-term